MPFASHFGTVCALLFFYGVYYGMTEGVERALVADFVAARDRGRAYGWYHGTVGFAALPASLMFGRKLEIALSLSALQKVCWVSVSVRVSRDDNPPVFFIDLL